MAYILNIADIESAKNKTTTIDVNSTDSEYPSAKAVYDLTQNLNDASDSVTSIDVDTQNTHASVDVSSIDSTALKRAVARASTRYVDSTGTTLQANMELASDDLTGPRLYLQKIINGRNEGLPVQGVADPVSGTDAVNLSYLEANTPVKTIPDAHVSNSAYNFYTKDTSGNIALQFNVMGVDAGNTIDLNVNNTGVTLNSRTRTLVTHSDNNCLVELGVTGVRTDAYYTANPPANPTKCFKLQAEHIAFSKTDGLSPVCIENVGTPVNENDAANKSYVDNANVLRADISWGTPGTNGLPTLSTQMQVSSDKSPQEIVDAFRKGTIVLFDGAPVWAVTNSTDGSGNVTSVTVKMHFNAQNDLLITITTNLSGSGKYLGTCDRCELVYSYSTVEAEPKKIQNVATPINDTDAANKGYVDSYVVRYGVGTMSDKTYVTASRDMLVQDVVANKLIMMGSIVYNYYTSDDNSITFVYLNGASLYKSTVTNTALDTGKYEMTNEKWVDFTTL